MDETSKNYATDAQKLDLNFSKDIIRIPTGDGAAIIFPFQSLQNIHLHFAISLLGFVVSTRGDVDCKIFSENGWCNCHDFFDIRIGVADGKAIVFKDINGNYNVAGNPVNVASRVMGLADRQQILITEEAYKNLIDMTEDTTLESRFISHGIMEVKHDIKLGVCQYVGSGENFLNSEIPFLVSVQTGMNAVKQQHPMFNNLSNLLEPGDPKNILQVIEHASEVMNIMSSLTGGSGDDMNQFMQLITKPEAVEKLREFVTTSNRLTELKKTLFIEGRGNWTSL